MLTPILKKTKTVVSQLKNGVQALKGETKISHTYQEYLPNRAKCL